MNENLRLLTKNMRDTDLLKIEEHLAIEKNGEIYGACVMGMATLISGLGFRRRKVSHYTVFEFEDGFQSYQSVSREVLDWLGGEYLDAGTLMTRDLLPMTEYLMHINDYWGLSWEQMADLIDYFGIWNPKSYQEMEDRGIELVNVI